MTEALDQVRDMLTAINNSYSLGYRDAKLELRRRLRAVAVGKGEAAIEQTCAMLAIVSEFIDV
jgi:hypothetical protein